MAKTLFDKENFNRPFLAVNAIILKKIKGKIHLLIGKRKNVAGAGFYYPPGGHVRVNEKLIDTLIREVKEECGLKVNPGRLVWIEEAFKPNHHVIIYYEAILKNKNATPVNIEPNKCERWEWHPIDKPPKPLWHDLGDLLKLLQKEFK